MKDRLALVAFEWAGRQVRAWAFDGDGEILSSMPASAVATADWPVQIRERFIAWLGFAPEVPVIGCGDTTAPFGKAGENALRTPAPLALLSRHLMLADGIHAVPWLAQDNPPDLTCGAETRLAGLGEVNGFVCMADRHTHHCVIEHGRLTGFSTEITSSLRDLLLAQGPLALTGPEPQAFDMTTFQSWVERALDTEDSPPVFAVEAALRQDLLNPSGKSSALAGLLIGADIAAHYDPGDEVLLVADGPLLEAYGFALEALGAEVEETSAVEAVQNGLFELADLAGLLGEA